MKLPSKEVTQLPSFLNSLMYCVCYCDSFKSGLLANIYWAATYARHLSFLFEGRWHGALCKFKVHLQKEEGKYQGLRGEEECIVIFAKKQKY